VLAQILPQRRGLRPAGTIGLPNHVEPVVHPVSRESFPCKIFLGRVSGSN
jgi:hypothetical protein